MIRYSEFICAFPEMLAVHNTDRHNYSTANFKTALLMPIPYQPAPVNPIFNRRSLINDGTYKEPAMAVVFSADSFIKVLLFIFGIFNHIN